MPDDNAIRIEFDDISQSYYIVWRPIVIGAGNTCKEALEDLREAAHFGVDTILDMKLGEYNSKGVI